VVAVGDIDVAARQVLSAHFPGVPVHQDIHELDRLPDCDILAAGFPCQDLSPAGTTGGIGGSKSGVVATLFSLLKDAPVRPDWVLLENVPFMLHLHKGAAMRFLTTSLSDLGYRWAYRVVDTRGFGLPQRRRRVLVVASLGGDPAAVLLQGNEKVEDREFRADRACGFYWTEGNTGVGWAVDAVPPLKGGSGLGIPSAPAVWVPGGHFLTPDIRDAERLQGFPADWTTPADASDAARRKRWRLVGNAVSVPVARWLGEALMSPGRPTGAGAGTTSAPDRWPDAGYGGLGTFVPAAAGPWPATVLQPHLVDFLIHEGRPLSLRAASGFLSRAQKSSLRFAPGLLDALGHYVAASESVASEERRKTA